MTFADLFSPLRRQWKLWCMILVLVTSLALVASYYFPVNQKITVNITVKAQQVDNAERYSTTNLAELTIKTAETIASWARNPAFRQQIMDQAGIFLADFHQRISANTQNNFNVLWTIKLPANMNHQPISASLITNINQQIDDFNQKNPFPFGVSTPTVHQKDRSIPFSWLVIASVWLGFMLSLIVIYGREMWAGRVSFVAQVKDIFGEAAVLQISQHPSAPQMKQLDAFLLSFAQPKLVAAFLEATDHFQTIEVAELNMEQDCPIVMVRLGQTKLVELENWRAIAGTQVGVVIFTS